ncbi:hypothetical protein FRUB_10095 [Fimbriiglobus ruber]|uniref:Uncharacterized protein n=1 Tax=Fimbriiglobus ruber TaxID=1908690 RepID=A0A225D3E7_9BACT|nr:hypothetical protein FRUB_10095 [Fimbriiglobus ruber]
MIVRPTSEDVVTGNLFQTLKVLNPRWWLPDLLNDALGVRAFHRQVFRDFRIEPWVNKPTYPRELLPWDEGSTQVDVTISWENPPTTVYVEMKYGSDLSHSTSRNSGQHGFPADQLSRNARVGLLECGYFQTPTLFEGAKRDFLLLVISLEKGQPLVARYRDADRLRAAIPHSDLIPRLPRLPFIGELGYDDLVLMLRRQKRWLTLAERILVDELCEYLEFKLATRPRRNLVDPHASLFQPDQDAAAGIKLVELTLKPGEKHAEAESRPTSP